MAIYKRNFEPEDQNTDLNPEETNNNITIQSHATYSNQKGIVQYNPDFKVDNFEVTKKTKDKYTFFLSHCHEDHLTGLT